MATTQQKLLPSHIVFNLLSVCSCEPFELACRFMMCVLMDMPVSDVTVITDSSQRHNELSMMKVKLRIRYRDARDSGCY